MLQFPSGNALTFHTTGVNNPFSTFLGNVHQGAGSQFNGLNAPVNDEEIEELLDRKTCINILMIALIDSLPEPDATERESKLAFAVRKLLVELTALRGKSKKSEGATPSSFSKGGMPGSIDGNMFN
ncbi:hypothetical protein CVT26_003244 [Gymnopilus dilepis]|uniref:Uncharacterized protein n=1 Tax=Gymnopilus dilepis TaxID=231916 RepID=A0A409Y595_9AGAR|nr:hypothetical protein CVT26_003244 [Gymnopilus dilepis]